MVSNNSFYDSLIWMLNHLFVAKNNFLQSQNQQWQPQSFCMFMPWYIHSKSVCCMFSKPEKNKLTGRIHSLASVKNSLSLSDTLRLRIYILSLCVHEGGYQMWDSPPALRKVCFWSMALTRTVPGGQTRLDDATRCTCTVEIYNYTKGFGKSWVNMAW